jgi:potassium efflux system protein
LLEVAAEYPLVLKDPEPQAFMVGFGESSLDFTLRVFSSEGLNNFADFKHQIHQAINKKIAEHDLEIPFPQRDVHFRESDAPVVIHHKPLPQVDVNIDFHHEKNTEELT